MSAVLTPGEDLTASLVLLIMAVKTKELISLAHSGTTTVRYLGLVTLILLASLDVPLRASSPEAAIIRLGDYPPSDVFHSPALALSGNGDVVVGYATIGNSTVAYRWTHGGGFSSIGDLPGSSVFAIPHGLSIDGQVIVGESRSSASGSNSTQAFRWRAGLGMEGLQDLPGGPYGTWAEAVSDDGNVVVGGASVSFGGNAVYWDSAGLIHNLGLGNPSQALDVNADGTAIVGTYASGPRRAYRWTTESGVEPLGDLNPFFEVDAIAETVSADGRIVHGISRSLLVIGTSMYEPFRWTPEAGMVGLGFPVFSVTDASADGTIIVGNDVRGSYIWSGCRGLRALREILEVENGLDLGGYNPGVVQGVSDNGTRLCGWGGSPTEGWYAIIPPPVPLETLPGDFDRNGVVGPGDSDGFWVAMQGPAVECWLCPQADYAGDPTRSKGGVHPDYAPDGRVDLHDYAALQRFVGNTALPDNGCDSPLMFDLDGDCVFDAADYEHIDSCLTGPGAATPCPALDHNYDGITDLCDVAALQRAVTP